MLECDVRAISAISKRPTNLVVARQHAIPTSWIVDYSSIGLKYHPHSKARSLKTQIKAVERRFVKVQRVVEDEFFQDARPPGPIAFHHASYVPTSRTLANVADEPSVPRDLTRIVSNQAALIFLDDWSTDARYRVASKHRLEQRCGPSLRRDRVVVKDCNEVRRSGFGDCLDWWDVARLQDWNNSDRILKLFSDQGVGFEIVRTKRNQDA
jgi:hypothetical protein